MIKLRKTHFFLFYRLSGKLKNKKKRNLLIFDQILINIICRYVIFFIYITAIITTIFYHMFNTRCFILNLDLHDNQFIFFLLVAFITGA